jgi:hypothetical protein
MIDLWNRLHMIFDIQGEVYPEIEILNLSEESTRWVIQYIVDHMRTISSQFRTFMSESPILVTSPQQIVDGVSKGRLIGAVGGELRISQFPLCEMLYIFEEPGFMVLSYGTGLHWNALNLIGLFEFFRLINLVDKKAKIRLSPHFFTTEWMKLFDYVLSTYLNDKK